VALLDLFSAASIRGRLPRRRALVAIQPACTDWGTESTAPVRAAVEPACALINGLARDWRDAEAAA